MTAQNQVEKPSGTYYSRNREKVLAQQREYRRLHPERDRAYEAKRDKEKRRLRMKLSEKKLQAKCPWRALVRDAGKRAKKKGLDFDLTSAWARDRWTGRCEVSGLEFKKGSMRSMFSASIDRIDPKMGYTQGNCRFILMAVNMLKGWGSDDEMFLVAAAVAAMKK